ncbi:protein TPLATE isoform X2 [Physcomitrium patens]|uniref:protein TPLATE isoform X2 n=1 Tax=Physcomitrium patens TaxID=3218 RepID=UPI000D151652|nr:protein TPLATE-like isoform X2 [Physcomitrium patens]|eukprot:XP_024368196.1 protein TPLATE-like isoform X2 [Physcomitrella patens]
MDHVFASIRAELASNDGIRQAQALLLALQHAAGGKDISSIASAACEQIIASPASAVCKKLAFDLIRCTRLTADQWEVVCRGIQNDFNFPDSDVTAAAVSFLSAIPSWWFGKFITDISKEISNCLVHDNPNLRYAIVETLGCLLARDDVVNLCVTTPALLERVGGWWRQIGESMLHPSDAVARIASEGVGRLFLEFSTKKLSRLAGDKLAPSEDSLAIRASWVVAMCRFVWEKRDLLMARSKVLTTDSFRATVFPLVFSAKAVATRMVEDMQKLSGYRGTPRVAVEQRDFRNAEHILGISDVVSHLMPYLFVLDPALLYEVSVNLLSLADVPGGKPEWASAPITALLTLWDRQEFNAGRESIVRAVVKNLQLLDLHLQVSLFKRLLLMVRNLRVEADRMHALACICRTALSVDLFAKESVRRGPESRVIGALNYGIVSGAMSWTQSALEVVEVCRPCVKWDCQGRTYAMDCYLKLLVRLCHIYDTVGGVKKAKDGASPEQIQAEIRLQALQKQLVKDLSEVTTARLRARFIWALAEHFDLESLDPLLADDPEDPLNIIIDHIHKVIFNTDSTATIINRLQDVQALLVCSEHLGSRNLRAAQMLKTELEEFRNSALADSVNKHQCRLILQKLKYISNHPDNKWVGNSGSTGDYPFTHHKLSVQYFDVSAAQDRKLEDLVHTAVQELWRPAQSELTLATSGMTYLKAAPMPKTLSGSSDPCFVEAYHLTDPHEKRLTLHLKILNLTEQELKRVDVRVGLIGALRFMDGSAQGVRQLQQLHTQDPVLSSVTVGVSRFERCSLCVQVLYYPFFGGVGLANGEEGEPAPEEGSHNAKLRKNYSSEYGEPVILRCGLYRLPLIELLVPYALSPVEFFRLWPSLPAIVEYTGAYTYESVGLKAATVSGGYMEPAVLPVLSGLKALSSKPFHKVCSHVLRTVAGFQICYAAKSWYGDLVGMMIFGTSEVSGDVDLGEETKTMVCKFVVRSSSGKLVDEIGADVQTWLDDLTDNALRGVSDKEVEAAAAEKLKRLIEILNVIRAKPPPQAEPELDSDSEDDSLLPGLETKPKKKPTTLFLPSPEDMEHQALQSAVLHEWHKFRLQQAVN